MLRLGYVPLTDAAPLVLADALGLFETVGLRVALSAEAGWAVVRDKLAFGGLDAAHLLGPMPIALACGLGGVRTRLDVTAGLGANGNTVTLSHVLAEEIGPFEPPLPAAAFAGALRRRAAAGRPPATLAVVFPFSSHNYLLRHWLAGGGLDPDRDLRLVVVPPPLAARRLAEGAIDGFCAGEPWGSQAVALGAGRVALTTGDIWPDHPEKALGFAEGFAAREPESAIACTAAVIAAARWLDDPADRAEAVQILRARALPGLDLATIALALEGRVAAGAGSSRPVAAPLRFRAASLPRIEAAAWWLGQMRRWGHLPPREAADTAAALGAWAPGPWRAGTDASDAAALAPWRPDLWRLAAARLGEPEPPPPPPASMPPETVA